MWDLIVSVPDHCLYFYFAFNFIQANKPILMYRKGIVNHFPFLSKMFLNLR